MSYIILARLRIGVTNIDTVAVKTSLGRNITEESWPGLSATRVQVCPRKVHTIRVAEIGHNRIAVSAINADNNVHRFSYMRVLIPEHSFCATHIFAHFHERLRQCEAYLVRAIRHYLKPTMIRVLIAKGERILIVRCKRHIRKSSITNNFDLFIKLSRL